MRKRNKLVKYVGNSKKRKKKKKKKNDTKNARRETAGESEISIVANDSAR